MNGFEVVKDFEAALCEYTGARYAVTTTSCTMALLLACKYLYGAWPIESVIIPKRTYIGVPQSIRHAGYGVAFEDLEWLGEYRLKPLDVWDAARRFTSGMYHGGFQCVSFHITKILGIDQGGAILHDDPEADIWLRRARFDGRREQVDVHDDRIEFLGYHCYMSPGTAAEGLRRLMTLPKHNTDLPNSNYSDLSLDDWNAMR